MQHYQHVAMIKGKDDQNMIGGWVVCEIGALILDSGSSGKK